MPCSKVGCLLFEALRDLVSLFPGPLFLPIMLSLEFHRVLKPSGLFAYSSPISYSSIKHMVNAFSALPEPHPHPPHLALFESNRPSHAERLFAANGFAPHAIEEVEYEAVFEDPRRAAQGCLMHAMNLLEGAPSPPRKVVMDALLKDLEGEFGAGEVRFSQRVLVAVGRKVNQGSK